MNDVTVLKVEEMESVYGGMMVRARAALGVSAFGMQIINLPPRNNDYPEHDEAKSRQEEVYTALSGSATLHVDGQAIEVRPGVFVRVGAGTKRKFTTGDEAVSILALGGVPGEAFAPAAWSQLGAPPPGA